MALYSEYFLVLCDCLLCEFLWVSLTKLGFYVNLQGDMGFQGRSGPPGPPGLGEPGPPVSYEDSESVLWQVVECLCVCDVHIPFSDKCDLYRKPIQVLWPEHCFVDILYNLALFIGTSRTTRCSRRERTPWWGVSWTKGIILSPIWVQFLNA